MTIYKRITLILIATGVVAALFWALRPQPEPVVTYTAERGYFASFIEEEGRTRIRNTYNISTPISGFLRRVELEPGDWITAGDTVFSMEPTPAPALDSRTREQARETLAAAQARLEAQRAILETRETETEFTRNELRRNQSLFERGAISATQIERLENDVSRAQASERAARASVEAARYEVENARAVLEITEGTRSSDDTVLRVTSPVSGLVLRRERCCEGVVQAGQTVLEIGDLHELEIQVDLLSSQAVQVRQGMAVIIERWGGDNKLEGLVRRVEPAGFTRFSALGVEEQRVPVLISLTSPIEQWESLGDSYRVDARIILREFHDVVSVPSSALFREDDQWFVFVIQNSRAQLTRVTPGAQSGIQRIISNGLEGGETVILQPPATLNDGQRINAL